MQNIIKIFIVLSFIIGSYMIIDTNKQKVILKTPKIKQKYILFEIEKLSKYIKINTLVIKFNNHKTTLCIYGKTKDIINFIYLFEKMAQITSIDFKYDTKLLATIQFVSNSFKQINYQNIKLINAPNPFIAPKQTKKANAKAIIGDYVLLDNHWYKKGDKYKGYIIKQIYQTYIILQKNNRKR